MGGTAAASASASVLARCGTSAAAATLRGALACLVAAHVRRSGLRAAPPVRTDRRCGQVTACPRTAEGAAGAAGAGARATHVRECVHRRRISTPIQADHQGDHRLRRRQLCTAQPFRRFDCPCWKARICGFGEPVGAGGMACPREPVQRPRHGWAAPRHGACSVPSGLCALIGHGQQPRRPSHLPAVLCCPRYFPWASTVSP